MTYGEGCRTDAFCVMLKDNETFSRKYCHIGTWPFDYFLNDQPKDPNRFVSG